MPLNAAFNRRHALLATAALASPPLRAQTAAPASFEPPVPMRATVVVVPFGPGGIADLTARATALGLSRSLHRPVIVENRPSAGSIVATQAVLSARPDGFNLLLLSNGHAVSAGLFKRLPYDTLRDLVPVTTLGFFDLGLFVGADSRFASLPALRDWALANPGRLNIGTINAGSTQHLAAKLFESVAGIRATVVPYKGTPAVLTALRSGEVDLAFEIAGPLLGQVRGGAIRALAVSSAQRNPALPDVPTVQQLGITGYDVASWNALAVAAGTPAEIVERLNRGAREALAQPELQERFKALGVRPAPSSSAEARELLEREIRRWGAVIRAAGIEPE